MLDPKAYHSFGQLVDYYYPGCCKKQWPVKGESFYVVLSEEQPLAACEARHLCTCMPVPGVFCIWFSRRYGAMVIHCANTVAVQQFEVKIFFERSLALVNTILP